MSSSKDRTSLALNLHETLLTLSKGNQNQQLHRMWRDVLSADDDEKLFDGLKLLSQSFGDLRRQVEACPLIESSRPMHLSNIKSWETLLSAKNLHTNAKQHALLLDVQRLNHLLSLNDTLRQWYPRTRLKASTIIALKRRIDALLEEVQGSDLEQGLRSYIIAQLSALAWALANFDHFGADGVYEVVTAVAARTRARSAKETDPRGAEKFKQLKTLVSRFWRVLDGAVRLNHGRAAFEEMWTSLFSQGGPPTLPPPGM